MKDEQTSDFLLERYILKELSPEEIQKVEEDIKNNPETGRRIDILLKSNIEILNKYKSGVVAGEISRRYDIQKSADGGRAERFRGTYRRFYLPSAAVAAAAVVLLFILPLINTPDRNITDISDEVRIKGDKAALYVYRKKNNNIELLKNGSIAAEKDLLQIACASTENPYGVILSIDGRGTVTLHYPARAGASTRLEQKRKTMLPHSYELDDAPGFERFFLITGKNEIDAQKAINAAKALAVIPGHVLIDDLKLDKSLSQISILIKKGE